MKHIKIRKRLYAQDRVNPPSHHSFMRSTDLSSFYKKSPSEKQDNYTQVVNGEQASANFSLVNYIQSNSYHKKVFKKQQQFIQSTQQNNESKSNDQLQNKTTPLNKQCDECGQSRMSKSQVKYTQQSPPKQSLLQRFHLNQCELRSKFQSYLHRNHLPLTSLEQYSHYPTFRELRRQRHLLREALSTTLSSQKFAIKKNESFVRSFEILKKKAAVIRDTRVRHHTETEALQEKRKALNEAFREENIQRRRAVQRGKNNGSKVSVIVHKLHEASEGREVKQIQRKYISQVNEGILKEKIKKMNEIRRMSMNVGMKIKDIKYRKKKHVDETKLEKIFREISEQEQIKKQYQKNTEQLEQKIYKKIDQNFLEKIQKIKIYVGKTILKNKQKKQQQVS